MKYQYPVKNYKVTCEFGRLGSWQAGWHTGVDLIGDYNIYPMTSGYVESINSKGSSYGNHIVIKHDDGMIGLYAHLSKINVSVGERVDINDVIGIMGKTGNATGIHLHFELHQNKYKYPPKNSSPNNCKWLVNPILYIQDRIDEQMELNEIFKEDWEFCKDNGFLDGTRPKDPITREEVSAVIHRLYEKIKIAE